jgi:hypothetical protein
VSRAPLFVAALALCLGVAGCATPSTLTTAQADTTKALIIADNSYHLATVEAIALAPSLDAATKAKLSAANDVAAAALHDAYNLRTASSISAASAAIAAFAKLAKGAKP